MISVWEIRQNLTIVFAAFSNGATDGFSVCLAFQQLKKLGVKMRGFASLWSSAGGLSVAVAG
jgi:hypothetical protein